MCCVHILTQAHIKSEQADYTAKRASAFKQIVYTLTDATWLIYVAVNTVQILSESNSVWYVKIRKTT